MMSSAQIARLADDAARRARKESRFPVTATTALLAGGDAAMRAFCQSIPFIGSWRPAGYKLVNASALLGSTDKCVPIWHDHREQYHMMQVDSSGFGSPDEPAFTQTQFAEAVRRIGHGYAYGIVEVGQFQVVVGVFKKEE